MKIKTESLPKLFEDVYNLLNEQRYSITTKNNHRNTYCRLKTYLENQSIEYYTEETGINFVDQHYAKEKVKYASRSTRSEYPDIILRIRRLTEVYLNSSLSVRRDTDPLKELKYLSESFSIYREIQQKRFLAERTVECKCFNVKQFFLYLENNGIKDVSEITVKNVYNYLNEKKVLAVSSKEHMLYILRDLFKSFTGIGLCNESLASLFPQISTHPESSVPSCYTPQELKKILLSVDRRHASGKRDYVILLMASLLGIRAGDIRDMKLGNIKWDSDTIEFTQSKTKKFLQLPMLHELKFALLDYLKNVRPVTQSENIFIQMNAPHKPYGSNNKFDYVLRKYLGDINIEGRKKGLHSLRFSAAGNLLSEGVNIITICNILGHNYYDTTNQYLKIDLNQLRKAALEVIE